MPLTTSTDLGFTVNWGDGVVETITDHTLAVHDYGVAGTYTISVTGSILGWQFNNGGDRLKMLNVSQWAGLNINTDAGFYGCTNLTASAIDAPLITTNSLGFYFFNCTNFNGAIGNWNVSGVTSMVQTFDSARAFNQPLSTWNVSNVTNMNEMFGNAVAFNQPIGNWSVSNVTNMGSMFLNATAFNQDVSDWNIANVTLFTSFMAGKSSLNYNPQYLTDIYSKWSLQFVRPNLSISFGSILYFSAGQSGKDILDNAPNNWTITDGGVIRNSTFEFSVKTDNAGTSTSTQFQMPLTSSTGLYFNVNWGDGSPIETITNHTLAIHTYVNAGTYTISTVGNLQNWQFNSGGDRLKMLNVSQWAGLNINLDRGFMGCGNLTASATDAPLITSLSLSFCFFNCTNFNGAIGNWNVSGVTNMLQTFDSARAFNQPIGTWNVSNVTTMNEMFGNAIAFNQPIGNWNVSNVTNMGVMFLNATAFNQDIGNWNVSNVTNFNGFMAGKTAANYSAANLDSIYNGWSSLPSVQPNLSISFGSIDYTAAGQEGKNILTNTYGWTITDGGVINEAEYQAVLDYATTQTYTLPTISQRNQQNLLLYNLKQDGIWSKLDTFAVFATDGDSDFALIDWKRLSQYTEVNSPTFTTNAGFNGNGTSSYINSNFNPLSDSIYMQTNDASFGMYIKTAGTITGRGHGNSAANGAGIYFNPNGTGAVRIWMNSGGVFSGDNFNRVGFYQIDRSSSLNVNYIKNGVQIENTTIDSTFRPDGNLYFLASLVGSSAGDFNDDQLSLVYAGSSLNSEKANFNNAVNTYITSI
jgi:surface protein